MPPVDDLQTQVDTLNQELSDLSQEFSDFSDSMESVSTDQEGTNSDFEDRLSMVEESSGQLLFPLSQETIDLITEQTPTMLQYLSNNNYIGTATLVAGTKTVTNPLITANSIVMLSRSVTGGTTGDLSYTVSAGSLVINSSSATDTSIIIWFILTT